MTNNQNDKIQEIQMLEQSLQRIMIQKQAFQLELSETQNALEELEKSDGDVFKIIGQLMLKTEKQKIKEELENKQKLLEIRLKTMEKQEDSIFEKTEKLRNEILKKSK